MKKMQMIVVDKETMKIERVVDVPMTKQWYETLQKLFKEEENESRKL